ncbi:hypothetical protein H0H92_004530 [Tricholoma furcatifolium]|nr:hypothetical protein H0H92_004530 [Tricholoma furcatifolium]
MLSSRRDKLHIGAAFLIGVILGPYFLNAFNPSEWGGGGEDTANTMTLQVIRVVIGIRVFALGIKLRKGYILDHWKSVFFLVVPVMTWGWFISTVTIYGLIPDIDFVSSSAIAACLAPTDPILTASVSKHIPMDIRNLLTAETGYEAAVYPIFLIPLSAILTSPNVGLTSVSSVFLWPYQLFLNFIIGAGLGFSFRFMIKFHQKRDIVQRYNVPHYALLTILTIGVGVLLDHLAAFVCGVALAWDGIFYQQSAESTFSSLVEIFVDTVAFIYVGAWMPFDTFTNAKMALSVSRLIIVAILILSLRRLPVIVALYKSIPVVKTSRDAIVTSYFGPIGIRAVYLAALVNSIITNTEDSSNPQVRVLMEVIQPIVAFTVLLSILIHSLPVPFSPR